ncbi:CFA45 protein, partial [Machaerirhynchus nigripectus]|nr:CFA45 protein [Machaerirhynchus nigripectus]
DVEEEKEQREKQKLLQRATRMRLEQEEEMRELTSLFLNSKCNMIRDKQILEKRMIRKELAEEEKRLDKMMEMEWEKGAAVQEERERQRRQEMMRARQDLVKQVEQNAEEWVLAAEELYQEGQRLLECLEQMKREDLKAWEQKQEIHADIKRSNAESQRLKDQQREWERLEDERVLEQQWQNAHEAAMEAEQEQLHLEKEELLQELQADPARAQHFPLFGQDALSAKLRQDPVYWEQRWQELKQAQRKAELKQWLRWNRLEQVAQQKLHLAMQVEQDCREFRRVLRAHQEQLEREKLEQTCRARQEHPPSSELRQCIRAVQQQREQERVAAQQCSQCLAQLGQQKLQEFRATGMPNKYCAQVE